MQSTALSNSPIFGNSKRYHTSARHHSFIVICIFVSIAKIKQVRQFNMLQRKRGVCVCVCVCVTTFLPSFVSKKGGVEEMILWYLRVTKKNRIFLLNDHKVLISCCTHVSANRKLVTLPPCLLELSFERSGHESADHEDLRNISPPTPFLVSRTSAFKQL